MEWYPSNPTGECVRENLAGTPYEEFSCLYPLYGKTYTDFELTFDPVPIRDWMRANPWIPFLAVCVYGAAAWAGRRYFAKREPWNWRGTLSLWNLGLSLFSFCGFCRMAPHLLHNVTHYTWRENFCFDPEAGLGSGSSGLWGQLFALSKFPELLDTFFIVIHKKPLIFLHWYHHISVLLFCWFAYVGNSPPGPTFCIMNYAVHAVMYFYYFLMAVHAKPAWFKPVYITGLQISQMFVGVTITAVACYLLYVEGKATAEDCYLSSKNNAAALIMYGSYLMLFVQFFWKRYAVKTTTGSKKKKL